MAEGEGEDVIGYYDDANFDYGEETWEDEYGTEDTIEEETAAAEEAVAEAVTEAGGDAAAMPDVATGEADAAEVSVETDTTTTDYTANDTVADDTAEYGGEADTADYPETIQEGNFRLVLNPYSENPYEGRAEYYGYSYNTGAYEWGTICDDGFFNAEAKVFCNSLGLPSSGAVAINYYGGDTGLSGTGEILMDDVYCTGNEYDLQYCSYTSEHNCGHTEDVGVVCQDLVLSNGNTRLVLDPASPTNQTNAFTGRVEVSYDGVVWGSVCDDSFNDVDAAVVCNSLGLPSGGAAAINYYGGSTGHMNDGSILMDDVYCNGDEYDLWGCYYITEHNCGHTEDVGVTCAEGLTIENGNFRMILDPATEYQYYEEGIASGRIEYYNGYEWGTVCDDYFDLNNNGAAVFCNSLGLPSSQASSYRGTSGSGAINLDDVQC